MKYPKTLENKKMGGFNPSKNDYLIKKRQDTAYIIVHPDDYAFENSSIIENVKEFKIKLSYKIKLLLLKNTFIFVMSLSQDEKFLPEFLTESKDKIIIVPLQKKRNVAIQVYKLKQKLFEYKNIKNVIFTGGWKDACFKFTLNQIAKPSFQVLDVDEINSPLDVIITFQEEKRHYSLEVDHEFVF